MLIERFWAWGAAAIAVLVLGLALALAAPGDAAKQRPNRSVYLSAVEWKGSASVAKEAYPGTGSLPCTGCGYESFAPGHEEVGGDTTKWAVETYRFDTSTVVAYAGDRLTLNIFGVNAKLHDIVIPAFKKKFTVKRGVLSKVAIDVDKPGIYKMLCVTHPPAHQADIVVLPRP